MAIFANFFEAGDLWPRARVFYGETEYLGAHELWNISPGVLGRLSAVLSCIQIQTTRRLCNDHPERSSRSWPTTPPDACITGHTRSRSREEADPAQSPRQQRTRSRIVPNGPCRGDAHLYGGQLWAGRRQEAVCRRLWVLSYKLSPDLTVPTRHDIGRLSKQRARRFACSTQSDPVGSDVDDGEDDANIGTVARQLATPRDRLGLPPIRHKPCSARARSRNRATPSWPCSRSHRMKPSTSSGGSPRLSCSSVAVNPWE